MVATDDLELHGDHPMATAAERMRALRKRKKRQEVVVPVRISLPELAQVAQLGYAGGASKDRQARGDAVTSLVSDTLFRLRQ